MLNTGIIYFRIVWILGSSKINRNVRTLEELLPNHDQDGHQLTTITNRDNLLVNTVSYKTFTVIVI